VSASPDGTEPAAEASAAPLELCCEGCGDSFVFSAGEARYFRERGLVQPKRCPACRAARRKEDPRRQAPDHEDDPQARPCDACGALTRVPFEPKGERPIYCERCFKYR